MAMVEVEIINREQGRGKLRVQTRISSDWRQRLSVLWVHRKFFSDVPLWDGPFWKRGRPAIQVEPRAFRPKDLGGCSTVRQLVRGVALVSVYMVWFLSISLR